MPTIRPSADLRNKYREISGKKELFILIDEGLDTENKGKVKSSESVFSNIRNKMSF